MAAVGCHKMKQRATMRAGYKSGVEMIKARAQGMFLFGLSARNLQLLAQGKMIVINLAELGGPNEKVLIFSGETEESMRAALAPYITPETRVHGEEN